MTRYSVIVPVYNRPDEVKDLLDSLQSQHTGSWELLLIEDGSDRPSADIAAAYADRLPVRYYSKPNSGPGPTRNYGATHATGEYLIFLDSDVLVPPGYFTAIDERLDRDPLDAFGGPDAAHQSFTPMQKAINYAMTGLWTTGGIRGGHERADKFYPRSFNMGIRRTVFEALGGFSAMRFGEDIDLSLRIIRGGYRSGLIKDAFVYHKRRTDLKKFFKQVFNSGIARIHLAARHPGSMKWVHTAPAVFVAGSLALILAGIWCDVRWFIPLLCYCLLLFVDAWRSSGSATVSTRAVAAGWVQLWGYGSGFLYGIFSRYLLRKGERGAFEKNFYE